MKPRCRHRYWWSCALSCLARRDVLRCMAEEHEAAAGVLEAANPRLSTTENAQLLRERAGELRGSPGLAAAEGDVSGPGGRGGQTRVTVMDTGQDDTEGA